ncbi:hypothetical protein A2U01_0056477, partial [Trifolium medium]|nr:hypothetical protein [Trifolium medium]
HPLSWDTALDEPKLREFDLAVHPKSLPTPNSREKEKR